jgi:3-methylfumaryl-CoA hydratase
MHGTDLSEWVGKREERSAVLESRPATLLALTFDQVGLDLEDGSPLPELWHWLSFVPTVPTSGLGSDGHPQRGGFLPPIALERRMWAGGRLEFRLGLHVGEKVQQTSEIVRISEKQGKAGAMVLVTVRHTVVSGGGLAVVEEQDLVYLPMPERYVAPPPDPLPDDLEFRHEQRVDSVLLFRFSALTFNAHRIHYDRPYATEAEHYPGLVVHGPLQAMLLMEAARRHRPDTRPANYTFRASRPLFDFESCTVAGRSTPEGGTDLFTANGAGDIAMRAHVTWR